MGYLISDERINEKAKQLNVEVVRKYRKNNHTYLEIHCLNHPDKPNREVELYNFLNRSNSCGCMLQRYTIEDLKANPKVRQDLEIIGEYVNNSTPIKCRCKVCGYEWTATPNKLTQGRGCPQCSSLKNSSGERYITKILQNNNIKYISQKSFLDLKGENNRLLRFDFFLPDYNLCIEFQGIQHYQPTVFRYGSKKPKEELQKEAEDRFERSQINDQKKRDYCLKNNIFLLAIPYYQKEDIEHIILDKINQIKETVTTAGQQQ